MNHHRFLRVQLLSTTIATALAAPLSAQSPLPAYMPLNARYRVVSTSHTSQVMMGQSQDSETSSSQLSTVVIAKDGAGLVLTITLDSASSTTTAPTPAPDLSAAVGLKFTGTMAPDGRVLTHTVTDKTGNPSTSPLGEGLRSFLPILKVGATPGATWADTTNTTRPQGGGVVTTVVITTYTLAGDSTVAGTKHWKINSTSAGTVSGTGNQNGADFTIKGSIVGAGIQVVGAGGALVGANLTNDAKLMVDVPMASLQIPITQKQTTMINRVP